MDTNRITAKTVKTVINMHKSGVDNVKIAERCGVSVQSVDGVLEADNQNKVHISSGQMSLLAISNDLDCESANINGIANLLFCVGDSVTELTEDTMCVLGNCLFNIHEKLNALSEAIMELQRKKV